jgi:hypothetical protein
LAGNGQMNEDSILVLSYHQVMFIENEDSYFSFKKVQLFSDAIKKTV